MVFQRDPGSQYGDFAPEQHHRTHALGGGDALTLDEIIDAPADGSILVAQSIGGGRFAYREYAIVIPAANVRNALAVDNGETRGTWKATLDTTNPTTIVIPNTAAPGTSLLYAHRDHAHGEAAHNVLSAGHADAVTASVVRGDIFYGNSTPKADRLPLGTAGQRLSPVSSDLTWKTPASYSANGGSLAATTNTTGLMGGLGSSATVTPTFSGNVWITIYGYGSNASAGVDGYAVGIRTGTGAAPAAGAALTGTARGNVQFASGAAGINQTIPFSVTVLVSGLTVGTAYWIDLSKASLAGGSATISSTYISAIEV